MRPYLKRLEHLVDKSVPFALAFLLALIVLEFFFVDVSHRYESWINIADLAIIGLFTMDLGFKYRALDDKRAFIKKYWLEIIAILPLFFIYRTIELFLIPRSVEAGQEAIHAGIAGEKEVVSLLRSSESSRVARLSKFIRLILRLPRFAKAAQFFREPQRHHKG